MDPVTCLERILHRISKKPGQISLENITEIQKMLHKIGHFAIENSLPDSVIEKILLLLLRFQCSGTFHLPTSELFLKVYERLDQLSNNVKIILIENTPFIVEKEVLLLLKSCSNVDNVSELSIVDSTVSKSSLPEACSSNPSTFQRALHLLGYSWYQSDFDRIVAYLIHRFVRTVDGFCTKTSILDLFPKEISHLVFAFYVPDNVPQDEGLCFQMEHIVDVCITAVETGLCDNEDLLLLCVIFPTWFHRILAFILTENDAKIVQFCATLLHCNHLTLRKKAENFLENPVWQHMYEKP